MTTVFQTVPSPEDSRLLGEIKDFGEQLFPHPANREEVRSSAIWGQGQMHHPGLSPGL